MVAKECLGQGNGDVHRTKAMSSNQMMDFSPVHYRPHGGTTWCGASKEAHQLGQDDPRCKHAWKHIKATTDISQVSCQSCIQLAYQAIMVKIVTREEKNEDQRNDDN